MVLTILGAGTVLAQPELPPPSTDETKKSASNAIPNQIDPGVTTAPVVSPCPIYTLPDCIQIALNTQPSLNAARASLASSQSSMNTLMGQRHIASLFAPDIDIRKQQSIKGVAVAEAELFAVQVEVIYNVTRNYWTIVYARSQADVAASTVKMLKEFVTKAQEAVKIGASRRVNASTVNTLLVYQSKVQEKQVEAEIGVRRAFSALREAMGVDQNCNFDIADRKLPRVVMSVSRDQVIAFATSRRAEIIQAALASNIWDLEVQAQGAVRFRPANRTFAMGADIHVKSLPQGSRDANYRPEALGLEMPTAVVGSKEQRMEKTLALSARTHAVYAKTVGLISLEAENSYLSIEEALLKLVPVEVGYRAALQLRKDAEKAQVDEARRIDDVQDIVLSQVLAAQSISGYNDALFQLILAITSLERVTAGGIVANFADVPLPELPSNDKGNVDPKDLKDPKDEKKDDSGLPKLMTLPRNLPPVMIPR